jgi:hypothetical protein
VCVYVCVCARVHAALLRYLLCVHAALLHYLLCVHAAQLRYLLYVHAALLRYLSQCIPTKKLPSIS